MSARFELGELALFARSDVGDPSVEIGVLRSTASRAEIAWTREQPLKGEVMVSQRLPSSGPRVVGEIDAYDMCERLYAQLDDLYDRYATFTDLLIHCNDVYGWILPVIDNEYDGGLCSAAYLDTIRELRDLMAARIDQKIRQINMYGCGRATRNS